jgi:uncharacterized delta-60 repeat protein
MRVRRKTVSFSHFWQMFFVFLAASLAVACGGPAPAPSAGQSWHYWCPGRRGDGRRRPGTVQGTPTVVDFAGGSDIPWALATYPDGRTVVAGQALVNDRNVFALARFNRDGMLDTTFGSGGKVTTRFGSDSVARAVVVQTDGKIVAAGGAVGQWLSGGPGWAAMVRYNVDGSIDESFNGGPIIWASYGSLGYGLTAMALQNDGKVVVVGPAANKKITKDNSSYGIDVWNDDFGVSRLNPDGSFDSGFGYRGSLFIDFGAVVNGWGGYRDYPSAVAIQANGKIVIGGTSLWVGASSETYWSFARLTSWGALDGAFGGNPYHSVQLYSTGPAGVLATLTSRWSRTATSRRSGCPSTPAPTGARSPSVWTGAATSIPTSRTAASRPPRPTSVGSASRTGWRATATASWSPARSLLTAPWAPRTTTRASSTWMRTGCSTTAGGRRSRGTAIRSRGSRRSRRSARCRTTSWPPAGPRRGRVGRRTSSSCAYVTEGIVPQAARTSRLGATACSIWLGACHRR